MANFLTLDVDHVQHFGIEKYLGFFKEISVPVRRMLTSYEEFGLLVDENFLVSMKLIELFEKINKRKTPKMVEDFVLTSEEGCYAKRIYMFVKDLIQEQDSPAKIEILLNYLSFDIFCSWYETEMANENGKECAECIHAFIEFANNYTYFANNAVFFLEIVFDSFVSS